MAEIWEGKYNTLSENDIQSTEWYELQPTSPYYLFAPQVTDYGTEYDTGWQITDTFQTKSIGIVTARDKLTIHRTVEEVHETVTNFASLSVDEARER